LADEGLALADRRNLVTFIHEADEEFRLPRVIDVGKALGDF
jgi:hypothetical protein